MRRERERYTDGFLDGVAAGVGATLVMFICRLASGTPMPQEALAERIALLLPSPIFALLVEELQHFAKPLAFTAAIGTILIGSGLGGAVSTQVVRVTRQSRLALGVPAAVATWVCLTYVFWPLVAGGVLGEPITTAASAPLLPAAVASFTYGALLAGLFRNADGANRTRPPASPPTAIGSAFPSGDSTVRSPSFGRRILLRSTLMALVAGAVSRLGTLADAAHSRAAVAASGAAAATSRAFRLIRGMPAEVTSTRTFYRVSKNFPFDPAVRITDWSFEVTGHVARPRQWSYAQFVAAASPVERYHTLECVTNDVGGNLIGNARWKGVRVRDILGLSAVRPGATAVIWRCADGYIEAVPLEVAMDAGSLLAYEMNGRPIPLEHGAPVRVLLPNRYGMKQPKWLTGIHVADPSSVGRWERRRLDNPATAKIHSAFRVRAQDGAVVELGGWAFAGTRGIASVEISADGGTTWFSATVKDALGNNCWQFWSAEWSPPAPGNYALWVRAIDGNGELQPGHRRRMPDGAEGYHEVLIRVSG